MTPYILTYFSARTNDGTYVTEEIPVYATNYWISPAGALVFYDKDTRIQTWAPRTWQRVRVG